MPGDRGWGDSGGWIDKTLDLSDVPGLGDLTGEPRVWVALIFASDGSVNRAEGAHIDKVVLRKYVPGAQAAQSEPLSAPPHTKPATLVDVPAHQVLDRPMR